MSKLPLYILPAAVFLLFIGIGSLLRSGAPVPDTPPTIDAPTTEAPFPKMQAAPAFDSLTPVKTVSLSARGYILTAELEKISDAPSPVAVVRITYANLPHQELISLTAAGVGVYRSQGNSKPAAAGRAFDARPGDAQTVKLGLYRRPGRLLVTVNDRLAAIALLPIPAAGRATLELSGYRLVKLRPQGFEPIRFGDNFTWDSLAERPWEKLTGLWRLNHVHDELLKRDGHPPRATRLEPAGEGVNLAVAGRPFWESYRATVMLRLESPGAAGIAFAVGGAHDFHAATLSVGKLRVFSVEAGREIELAAVAAPQARRGEWLALDVRTGAGYADVLLNGESLWSGRVPGRCVGRVGLYAAGGPCLFDDVEVSDFPFVTDDFSRPWPGAWRGASADQVAVFDFERADVRVSVRPADGATKLPQPVVRVTADGHGGYALRVSADGRPQIMRLALNNGESGHEKVLARGKAGTASVATCRSLTIEAVGARLIGLVNGEQVVEACDLKYRAGRAGLIGERAQTRWFQVSAPASPPPAVVFANDFKETYLPYQFGNNKGQRVRLVGVGCILVPRSGSWRHRSGGRSGQLVYGNGRDRARSVASGNTVWGRIAFHEPLPGDASVSATLASLERGAQAGVYLGRPWDKSESKRKREAGKQSHSGYALLFDAERRLLRLERDGREVSQVDCKRLDSLTLARHGPFLVALADGKPLLVYHDAQPLNGDEAGLIGRGGAGFVAVRFAHARGSVHPFDQIDPLWRPLSGRLEINTGMACIPWSHWATAMPRPASGTALALYRTRLISPGVQLSFGVSESTDGFESGDHVHHPYHDILVALGPGTKDLNRGYVLIIGADRGAGGIKLLRDGKLVAHDRRFTIRMGSHNNYPRALQISLRVKDGRLRLHVNGRLSLTHTDPAGLVLTGQSLTIGTRGCRANFRDIVVLPE